MSQNVYQPHQLGSGKWVIGFGGNLSKAAARAEAARLNEPAKTAPAIPLSPPNYPPDITSGLGIGGAGSDDYNIRSEVDFGGERYIPHTVKPGSWVCPAGTTQGQAGAPGDRCEQCGRPADWNPSAGQLLCRRHWDEY